MVNYPFYDFTVAEKVTFLENTLRHKEVEKWLEF